MNKQWSRPCSSEDCQQELRRSHDKHTPDSRRRRCLFFLLSSGMILTKRTGLHTTLRMGGMRNRSSQGGTQATLSIMHRIFAQYFEAQKERENRTTASGDKIHLLEIVANVKNKTTGFGSGQSTNHMYSPKKNQFFHMLSMTGGLCR